MQLDSSTESRIRDVGRMPRDSAGRQLFLVGVLTLAAGLCGWILWLLESVGPG